VLTGAAKGAEPDFAQHFERQGWQGIWRWSVYGFHHYHSNAHEVLGVVRGNATIRFGGERGQSVQVNPGDMVVIPAGVGHRNEESSRGFSVIGAYPGGQDPDLCRESAGEIGRAARNIAAVPLPESDPLYGEQGPLVDLWRAGDS